MELPQAIRRQGLRLPVLALLAASGVCFAWVMYRFAFWAQIRHAYLVWNLFLAWLPLVFAILTRERFARTGTLRDRKLLALATAWLLFFPNAPYIFTDLVHLFAAWHPAFWTELMLVLLSAFTGFVAGFLSLQLMHGLVTERWGRGAGWMFVVAVAGLSGFGVYLGRFVRLNSWNVVTHPSLVVEGTARAAWNVLTQWQHTKFFIVFSLFVLLGYVMLLALVQPTRKAGSHYES
jgi:uncharacterized membrane protein